MPPRSRTLAAGVLLAAALGLTACGGDDSSGTAAPSPSGTTSSAPTATTPTSATTESSPTGPAPATGLLLDLSVSSVNAPPGFTLGNQMLTSEKSANLPSAGNPANSDSVHLQEVGGSSATLTTDQLWKTTLEGASKSDHVKRLPDLFVGDDESPALQWTYHDGRSDAYELITSHGDFTIFLTYTFDPTGASTAKATWDSIVASLTWTG